MFSATSSLEKEDAGITPTHCHLQAAIWFGMVAPHLLFCCCLLLLALNVVVQSLTLSLSTTAPFCLPSPAAVLLLSLPAPACLHRSHQYLGIASSACSIVHPLLRHPPLTFAVAHRLIVNSFVASRHPLLLLIACCYHFALGSSCCLPLLFSCCISCSLALTAAIYPPPSLLCWLLCVVKITSHDSHHPLQKHHPCFLDALVKMGPTHPLTAPPPPLGSVVHRCCHPCCLGLLLQKSFHCHHSQLIDVSSCPPPLKATMMATKTISSRWMRLIIVTVARA
jgi:hypothetical protein